MRRRCCLSLVLLLAVAARGGTLVTTDGETLDGDIVKTDQGYVVTAADGTTTLVEARRVKSLSLAAATRPDRAAAGLASLRRSVEYVDDLPRIVARYQAFIARTTDPFILDAARKDLAGWQECQRLGLVKFGRDWVTPEQRVDAQRRQRVDAEESRLLIKSGRGGEAARRIAAALDQDPANASALYLHGVQAMGRPDLSEARRAFEAVRGGLPSHAPTLMNLAIINLRQKQWGPACTAYDGALAAAPGSQVLLDTAVEFMRLIPAEQGKTVAAQRLSKRFLEQDAVLQRTLNAQGQYRWGSKWIDQAERDRIQARVLTAQNRIKQIQTDFDATQQQIQRDDQAIANNVAAMNAMEAHSYVRAADGTRIRVPLPRAYYDLRAETDRLRLEQADLTIKLDSLRGQAKDAQAAMPQPTYAGFVLPIGEDGVPLADLPEPATQPAALSTPPTVTIPMRLPEG